jgi:hypothetical protein
MEKHTLKNLTLNEIKFILNALYGVTIKGTEARSYVSMLTNIEKQADKIVSSSEP